MDAVGVLDALDGLVRGDADRGDSVDLPELVAGFPGRAGHAAQVLVHAEEALEAYPGQRLLRGLDFDTFFGLDGLVEAVAPGAVGHEAAGELVDDDDALLFFDLLDDVLFAADVELAGGQGLGDQLVAPPAAGPDAAQLLAEGVELGLAGGG